MNVNEMSDQEKSRLIFKLVCWHGDDYFGDGRLHIYRNGGNGKVGEAPLPLGLYDESAMALAWKCIEWVTSPPKTLQMSEAALNTKFCYWWQGNSMWAETAAAAQRKWLDKILSLAIEAGMVQTAVSEDGEK